VIIDIHTPPLIGPRGKCVFLMGVFNLLGCVWIEGLGGEERG